MTLLFFFASLVTCAAAPARRLVDLGAQRGTGMIRVAGRHVRDLAVADRVLVGVRPGIGTVQTASKAVATFGGRVSRRLGGGRILVVELPTDSDILAVAEKLGAQSGIDFAEPDRLVYTAAIPTDPEYPNQPHLPKIKCPEAWDVGAGSPNVIIAVVDSGIDVDHPDLADQLWTNLGEIPNNGIDDDHNGYVDDVRGWDFYDDDNDVQAIPNGVDENHDGEADEQVSHGTLTAGLAAAAANDWGTVGVAWQATIMMLKVFPDDGGTYVSTVVEAMWYAADNGAHIMNLSIGAPYGESFTPPIQALWNNGGLTVSAGGNDYDEITDFQHTWVSPTCNNGPNPLVDNMNIGVGGVDLSDRKAAWSNYDGSTSGNFVEVFAPGVNLRGPGVYYPSIAGFTSYFTHNSGTSFSCPLVTGLAALLKAQDMNRTGADLIQLIRSSCDNIDSDNPGYVGKMGSGRINAARAMGADLQVAPPTNVAAADTPGDQGGSITITWTKSVDDGGGSNNVTGYIVSRTVGMQIKQVAPADFQWTDLVTLPKGTVEYADATTTDGMRYSYRVAAIAPGERSESEVAGPTFSFDDTAPPRVETLTVQDHPLDSGGAIDLDWTGYPGATDLVRFHIYRSDKTFAHVAGSLPYAVINNPGTRTYTDSNTVDGADYYYAVTGVDNLDNERKDVIAAGPVQSFPNGPMAFPAGLHMFGTPVVPLDEHPSTLLGIPMTSLGYYGRYSATLQDYVTYSGEPISEFLKLGLGRGFWIHFTAQTTATPSGTSAPAGNFSIDLDPGWQQIANPFFGSLDFSASTVTFGANTMDLESADSTGVMRSYAWMYDHDTGDYELVHPLLGATTTVPAWRGLWALADQSCTLTLMRPSGNGVSAARVRALAWQGDGQWPLQIIARGATNVDAANYFGVSAAPSGIQSPPQSSRGVELSFVSSRNSAEGARYATAFEKAAGQEMSWRFNVAWGEPQGSVVLSWPDLSRLPSDYSLTLHDLDTGRRMSMRHLRQYAVQASSATGARHFEIEARKGASSGVQITSLSASPTSTGGQVVFSLSQAAACDVVILNIAGRTVRAVETGRVRAAGANVVLWDARNASGAKAPPGQYLVRISACGDDGTVASALRSLHIQR